jgi:putative salt-induced outer membrane protein YdiY
VNKFVIVLSLLLQAPLGWAISNIENERPDLSEPGLSGSIKIGLNGKTGNQEERNNEGGAKIIYRLDDEIFMALLEREYGTKLKVKTTDNSFLHARWVHLLNDRWASEAFAQREEDEFDNLTSRVLVGGGGRYLIAKKDNVYSLALGLGVFHEVEKQNLVSYQETDRLWRLNAYYSYRYQLNTQVTLVNTTYVQPSTRDFGDFRVLFDFGLNVNLTNSLMLKVNYRLTHDSDPAKNLAVTPPIDNYKTNTQYETALAYNF